MLPAMQWIARSLWEHFAALDRGRLWLGAALAALGVAFGLACSAAFGAAHSPATPAHQMPTTAAGFRRACLDAGGNPGTTVYTTNHGGTIVTPNCYGWLFATRTPARDREQVPAVSTTVH